jgi:hypothetical protein
VEKELYASLICRDSEGKEEVFGSPVDSACLIPSRYFRYLSPPPVLPHSGDDDDDDDDPDDRRVSFVLTNVARVGTPTT